MTDFDLYEDSLGDESLVWDDVLHTEPDWDSADEQPRRRRRYTSTEDMWVRAGRNWFKRLSCDDSTCQWQAIGFHAIANCGENGHCPLYDGQIQQIVGNPAMLNKKAQQVINKAIEKEYLGVGSNVRCLIVPPDIGFGSLHKPKKPCRMPH